MIQASTPQDQFQKRQSDSSTANGWHAPRGYPAAQAHEARLPQPHVHKFRHLLRRNYGRERPRLLPTLPACRIAQRWYTDSAIVLRISPRSRRRTDQARSQPRFRRRSDQKNGTSAGVMPPTIITRTADAQNLASSGRQSFPHCANTPNRASTTPPGEACAPLAGLQRPFGTTKHPFWQNPFDLAHIRWLDAVSRFVYSSINPQM